MRFWLLVSWRHAWEEVGMDVRIFDNEEDALRTMRQYNAVIIEVYQRDKDLQTYVDAHDYEFVDKEREPQPGRWADGMYGWSMVKGWVVPTSPVVRVGRDISREEYQAMVEADEQ